LTLKQQLLLGAATAVLFAGATPALAAPPLPSLWSGFYFGGNAGYSAGRSSWTYNEPGLACCGFGLPSTISGSNDLNGAIGGVQAGYNIQMGTWVWGVETDFQLSGERGSSRFNLPYDCEGTCNVIGAISTAINWFGTTRGRAGVLINPTTLVYATGGVAYGQVSASGNFLDTGCGPPCTWSFSQSAIKVGYAAGAGFEVFPSFMPNWSLKVEYLYINLGSLSGTGTNTDFGPYSWTARFTDNIGRLGLNYHFP
jgi:outer membrane immunogenic protein